MMRVFPGTEMRITRGIGVSQSGEHIMTHRIITCSSGSPVLPTTLEGVKMASLCETSQNCVVTVH